jgi:hypothetical protein
LSFINPNAKQDKREEAITLGRKELITGPEDAVLSA